MERQVGGFTIKDKSYKEARIGKKKEKEVAGLSGHDRLYSLSNGRDHP